MSTEDFLQELNDSQLDMAITIAKTIKSVRASENTIKIWVVSGGGLNHCAFTEDKHKLAVTALVTCIKNKAEQYPDIRMDWELRKHEIRESELESWLKLKNGFC